LTFLRVPGLDATNWHPELAIRFGVILRKVWGGSRTWAGARAQSVLMSVWRTSCQQGGSALDFLSQLLQRPCPPDAASATTTTHHTTDQKHHEEGGASVPSRGDFWRNFAAMLAVSTVFCTAVAFRSCYGPPRPTTLEPASRSESPR
jgi:transposase